MSAFVCSDRHIATIATRYGKLKSYDKSAIQGLADLLKRENVRSVNYRYNQRQRIQPCNLFESSTSPLSFPDLVALCDCLDYQSCERPDYLGAALATVKQVFMENAQANGQHFKSAMWSI